MDNGKIKWIAIAAAVYFLLFNKQGRRYARRAGGGAMAVYRRGRARRFRYNLRGRFRSARNYASGRVRSFASRRFRRFRRFRRV